MTDKQISDAIAAAREAYEGGDVCADELRDLLEVVEHLQTELEAANDKIGRLEELVLGDDA